MNADGERGNRAYTFDVRIVEDDECGLTPEFEEDLLESLRGRGHHCASGGGGTGEGHEIDARIAAQLRA